MLNLPNTNLHIGNITSPSQTNPQTWAIVHATQTIHYQIFGWNRTTNKPDKNHPNYIYYENDNRLSLNWVDGAAFLYDWQGSGVETLIKVLDFVDKWIDKREILIHCDQGLSRSPTMGLLYLAKRAKLITNESFPSAKAEFTEIYPLYAPGGIGDFVDSNWERIV